MTEYLSFIPYFIAFVSFGVAVNYLFYFENEKITVRRVGREIFGAIWVSAIVYAISDEFFNFKMLFTMILCSVGGFANSKIITFLQKDFFEFLFIKLKDWISNLVASKKPRKDRWDDEEDDYNNDYDEEKPL